ncbi:HNH endonuclease [Pirellulales bacterium]|nr:HNH endonuclease [Pirellulales bacterium]
MTSYPDIFANNNTDSRAWLVIAAGRNRDYGGNDGYDDLPDQYYSWDSTVANSKKITAGDTIAIWDKKRLVGFSIVEEIASEPQTKDIFRCPNCESTKFKARKSKNPKFKCNKCKHEFTNPLSEKKHVTAYRSRHDAGWTKLPDTEIHANELRNLCKQKKSQQSLRELRKNEFFRVVKKHISDRDLRLYERRKVTQDGHVKRTVRVRLGQEKFRKNLLKRFGENCAICGPTPKQSLQACHLYSYAKIGEHHSNGGLLLRSDLHGLFDRGLISIHPMTKMIDLDNCLKDFPLFKQLHQTPLSVELEKEHVDWLTAHWQTHRNSNDYSFARN